MNKATCAMTTLATLMASMPAFGAGQASNSVVTNYGVSATAVFVKLSNPVVGAPACANNGYWSFAFPINLSSMTAAVITSSVMGTALNVGGTGSYSTYASIEDLASISTQ